jgi:type II secretory pathway pseudopilin PulG
MKQRAKIYRRGFWLVESAVAIAVIGISVVAVVGSQQAWHIQAVASEELATGMRLATEIRELSLLLPANDPITGSTTWGTEAGEILPFDIDDLDDLDMVIFSESLGTGPIDATGTTIVGMNGWEQQITVHCVNPFDITVVVADGSSDTVHLEVAVLHNGKEITRLPWIAPR